MKCSRRFFLYLATAAAALPVIPTLSWAQNYPSRPITLVVPFPPGGGNDIMARLVGERMSKTLDQPVVIENRPGAGGNIGSRQAARSAPDGYTILLTFTGTLAINPSLYANLGYDPNKELTPIGSISTTPAVMVVNPSLPVQNLTEFIAYAKPIRARSTTAIPESAQSCMLRPR